MAIAGLLFGIIAVAVIGLTGVSVGSVGLGKALEFIGKTSITYTNGTFTLATITTADITTLTATTGTFTTLTSTILDATNITVVDTTLNTTGLYSGNTSIGSAGLVLPNVELAVADLVNDTIGTVDTYHKLQLLSTNVTFGTESAGPFTFMAERFGNSVFLHIPDITIDVLDPTAAIPAVGGIFDTDLLPSIGFMDTIIYTVDGGNFTQGILTVNGTDYLIVKAFPDGSDISITSELIIFGKSIVYSAGNLLS